MVAAVAFPVTREVAFDYLADPRNRPRWQSSLARVAEVSGTPRVGQTWVDVTRPGLRPRMETTELERPARWSERGTWRSFSATLTLVLEPAGDQGCTVTPIARLDGKGVTGPVARLLGAVAPYAVRGDLRRAADLLARRGRGVGDR